MDDSNFLNNNVDRENIYSQISCFYCGGKWHSASEEGRGRCCRFLKRGVIEF